MALKRKYCNEYKETTKNVVEAWDKLKLAIEEYVTLYEVDTQKYIFTIVGIQWYGFEDMEVVLHIWEDINSMFPKETRHISISTSMLAI